LLVSETGRLPPILFLGDLDHLLVAGSWLITAAPALLTISSWESVPPETPIAPMIEPFSISGMPPRDAMTPSTARK
jgi:hypothetical protein